MKSSDILLLFLAFSIYALVVLNAILCYIIVRYKKINLELDQYNQELNFELASLRKK